MRKFLSMLKEIRMAQLDKRTLPDKEPRKTKVAEMFAFMDQSMNGVTPGEPISEELAETMTSGDFTYAIQEFVSRTMLAGYETRSFAFEPLVKPDVLPNYMVSTRYQNRGGVDDLEYVGEKGEARPGSLLDAAKRQYRVYRWAKQFDFSMEAIVNDDLGYLTDITTKMGQAARRTLERYVSRMLWNATTIARLVALGALYSDTGRISTARISTARMAFGQRVDDRGDPMAAGLQYIVHHPALVDTIAQIRRSTQVAELATNAANVIGDTFTPVQDPHLAAVAPNLPWMALSDYRMYGVAPFVLARLTNRPAPLILRKKSDIEAVSSLTGSGSDVNPIMGDFATGNIVIKVEDVWGTYYDRVEGNLFDARGAYYSSGTVA